MIIPIKYPLDSYYAIKKLTKKNKSSYARKEKFVG